MILFAVSVALEKSLVVAQRLGFSEKASCVILTLLSQPSPVHSFALVWQVSLT